MKMIYGGVPVESLKVKHYELNTNGATVVNSAVQAGLTYYANGKKEVGTGKSFEFANYGRMKTNAQVFIPTLINVVEIASTEHPIKSFIGFDEMTSVDFSLERTIGLVVVDNVEYPINIRINGNILTFSCEKSVTIEFFYGRDNYT